MGKLTLRSKGIVTVVALACSGLALGLGLGFGLGRTALADTTAGGARGETTLTRLTDLTKTIAGEPLAYPSTPDPVISSAIETIPPGAKTDWMTHPVPAYLYVLEGTLTVELADGTRHEFRAGESFLQCRTTWHRGRNEGSVPMRFLAVFAGAKGVPEIVHPPSGSAVGGSAASAAD